MTTHVRKHFENTDEFLAVFKLNEDSRYERATNLLNEKIGFSVQRTYPPEFRYKPPKLKNGESDTVALIYVSYDYPRTNVENEGSQLVPVTVRILKHSRYIAEHYDYNFEDENCPTEESVLGSKLTPQPVGLDYIGDFFFDHGAGQFIDRDGKRYSGIELLNEILEVHCNTIHPIKGLKLQIKLKTQSWLVITLNYLIEKIPRLLSKVFGRTLVVESGYSPFNRGYRREHFKKLSTETVNIFGYKASKSVIVVFCVLVAIIYAAKLWFGLRSSYLERIASSTLLAPIHLIIVLWFLDVVLPNGLFVALNYLIKWRVILMSRKLRFP